MRVAMMHSYMMDVGGGWLGGHGEHGQYMDTMGLNLDG